MVKIILQREVHGKSLMPQRSVKSTRSLHVPVAVHVLRAEIAHARGGVVSLCRGHGVAVGIHPDGGREVASVFRQPAPRAIEEDRREHIRAAQAGITLLNVERVAVEAQPHEREH